MVKTTGNSTFKTKQHNAQSRLPASTPSFFKEKTKYKWRGSNSGTTAPYREIREESGETLC